MTSITPPHSSLIASASSPEYKDTKHHVVVDLVLRVTLFATSFVAVVLVATSKQTRMVWSAAGLVPVTVKFNVSPAYIYYVAALSVACLYGFITGVLSVIALITKQKGSSREIVLLFVVLDSLLLGIMASATGAAGAIAYLGFIGDTHRRRRNLCHSDSAACLGLGFRALKEDGEVITCDLDKQHCYV
ncbi:hypothetical protein L2E82_48611 [Cichorium intybus]|uniref:Uncharacterized protein n=1 Tax=Cichorium intybus TaxID=13427 RepID=A0ACB8YZZ6_CICIN|nr:hypothetical protein L2E82_48611 [Cichorium intybus]